MGELIIVTMLAGGLLEIVRVNGGIDYLIQITTAKLKSKKGAEMAITSLTALANVCTANNTIAILAVGPVARSISYRYGIEAKRSASILDTMSCFAQGIIPWGAQLLIAAGLAAINPLDIIPYLYYPYILGVITIMNIIFYRKKEK